MLQKNSAIFQTKNFLFWFVTPTSRVENSEFFQQELNFDLLVDSQDTLH